MEENENENEDDGKEPWTISQREMVNTSAENLDTMVDNQPIVLPEQGQVMREHTTGPQPAARAPWPQTAESRPQPQMPETHPLSGLEDLRLVTPQKPRQAVPSLREAEAAGNTSVVDVDQQLFGESAGGDSLHNVPSPRCPSPWGTPGLLCRQAVNQSLHYSGGDDSCVQVRVRFLSRLFPWF